MLARPRRLVAYLALWMLVAAGLAGLMQMLGLVSAGRALAPGQYGAVLMFTAPLCAVYAFVAMSAYYLSRSQPLAQRRWPLAIAVFGAASLISGAAWLALGLLWNGVWHLAEGAHRWWR